MTGPRTMPLFELEDFDALVASGAVVEESDTDEMSELHRLSRRISGQYVDVLAAYARAAFQGADSPGLAEQVQAACDALLRLAEASDDAVLAGVLRDLQTLLPHAEARGGTRRRDFMRQLSAWVLAFAEVLPDDDAERLRSLVSYDDGEIPLLSRLSSVRGIGPKRLQRLYCAGLISVDAVAGAQPADVAAVTGIPARLAEDVVQAAVDFALEEREVILAELARRTHRLKQVVATSDLESAERRRIVEAAKTALQEIREVLLTLEHMGNP